MKICPQCSSVYEDDLLFCVEDGNALINDSAEVQTVVNEGFRLSMPGGSVCRTCGIGVPAGFDICENCRIRLTAPGQTVAGFGQQGPGPMPNQGGFIAPTAAWGQPVQMPPAATAATGRNNNVLIGVLAVLSIILTAVILFQVVGNTSKSNEKTAAGPESSSGETAASGKSGDSQSDSKKPDSDVKTPANSDATVAANTTQPEAPLLPYSFQHTYRGYSNRPLEMTLTKNGSSLSGVAKTPGDWDDLSGTIEPDGSFTLAGNNQGMGITGYWRGRISPNGSIRGVWTATGGRRVSYSVSQVR